MIDPRIIELINAEIDGELSADDRAELQQALAASEDARHYRQELNQLEDRLNAMTQHEVPLQLQQRILEEVELPEGAGRSSWMDRFTFPAVAGYGLTAAAALVLGVGVYQAWPDLGGEFHEDGLAGTVAPDGFRSTVLGTYSIDLAELDSEIVLEQHGDEAQLSVSLASPAATKLQIDLADSGYTPRVTAQHRRLDQDFGIDGQRIHLKGRGAQRFSVPLRKTQSTTPGAKKLIGLQYSVNGELLHVGALSFETAESEHPRQSSQHQFITGEKDE